MAATLAGLLDGEPTALAILGEPGIGKTRLLEELAARADDQGCTVLVGSGAELESDLPFAVFVDALDEYLAGLDPGRLATLDDDVIAELARLLPSLSSLVRTDQPAIRDERYRAHRAVRVLLERIAVTKPLVLILDDVHWADSASVELLGALLRRPPDAPVLMVMAARPRQLPIRLAGALDRAERANALDRTELAELDPDDARRLLGGDIDAELAERFVEESGGNPFYLDQLARSRGVAQPGPATLGEEIGDLQVPTTVVAALNEELGLLASPVLTLLQGAAVVGDPFEPDFAAITADLSEDAALTAVDELLERELIRATDVPRRFRFRHPIVRRAVYQSAPAGWTLRAHERCATALAERGAPLAARAHHVEHAARHGDPGALTVLVEAANAAALRAPASAARWYAAALRVMLHTAPPQERIGLLVGRAEALFATGRLEESREAIVEGIALVPDEAVGMKVRLTVACAGVEHVLGRHPEARTRVAEAIDRLGDATGAEVVALRVVLAFDGLFRADFDAMRKAAAQATEAARPTGERPLIAFALAVQALAGAWAGAIGEGLAACDEAAELVESMPDEELAGRIDAAAHVAAAEIYLDRYESAEAHAERALAVARSTGQSFPTLVPTLATAYFVRGKLTTAVEVIDDAVEAARLADNAQDLAWRLHVRSSAALATGDLSAAVEAAEEALALTRDREENFVSAYPAFALASALLPAGDPSRAVELLIGTAGGAELRLIPGVWRVAALELLTRCRLELDQVAEAAQTARLAEDAAAVLELPMAAAWADRAAAAVALASDQPAPASERALASAAAAEKVGAVVEAAVSRVLAGLALTQAGEKERAAAELGRAASEFDAVGAVRYRAEAEQHLRKLGHRIHRQTRRGPDPAGVDSLTERELEVARLVVDRKTNAEIAADLFLSVKTVESHMRNLFAKLNVSSRVEVARVIERAGVQ